MASPRNSSDEFWLELREENDSDSTPNELYAGDYERMAEGCLEEKYNLSANSLYGLIFILKAGSLRAPNYDIDRSIFARSYEWLATFSGEGELVKKDDAEAAIIWIWGGLYADYYADNAVTLLAGLKTSSLTSDQEMFARLDHVYKNNKLRTLRQLLTILFEEWSKQIVRKINRDRNPNDKLDFDGCLKLALATVKAQLEQIPAAKLGPLNKKWLRCLGGTAQVSDIEEKTPNNTRLSLRPDQITERNDNVNKLHTFLHIADQERKRARGSEISQPAKVFYLAILLNDYYRPEILHYYVDALTKLGLICQQNKDYLEAAVFFTVAIQLGSPVSMEDFFDDATVIDFFAKAACKQETQKAVDNAALFLAQLLRRSDPLAIQALAKHRSSLNKVLQKYRGEFISVDAGESMTSAQYAHHFYTASQAFKNIRWDNPEYLVAAQDYALAMCGITKYSPILLEDTNELLKKSHAPNPDIQKCVRKNSASIRIDYQQKALAGLEKIKSETQDVTVQQNITILIQRLKHRPPFKKIKQRPETSPTTDQRYSAEEFRDLANQFIKQLIVKIMNDRKFSHLSFDELVDNQCHAAQASLPQPSTFSMFSKTALSAVEQKSKPALSRKVIAETAKGICQIVNTGGYTLSNRPKR